MPNRMFRRPSRGLWEDVRHSLTIAPWVFMAAFTVLFFPTVRAAFETEFYPVVTPITVLSTHEFEGGLMVAAESKKVRQCAWVQTKWYLGERDGVAALLTDRPHKDPPKANGKGLLRWDRIFIPGVKSLEGTYADAIHECGFRWVTWPVLSRFFN